MKRDNIRSVAIVLAIVLVFLMGAPAAYAAEASTLSFALYDEDGTECALLTITGYLSHATNKDGSIASITVEKDSSCIIQAKSNDFNYYVALSEFDWHDDEEWPFTFLLSNGNCCRVSRDTQPNRIFSEYSEHLITPGNYGIFWFGANKSYDPVKNTEENVTLSVDTRYLLRLQFFSKKDVKTRAAQIAFIVKESTHVAVDAIPTSSKILVNGKELSFDAYNIDGSNYFKLRDLAYVLSGTEKQFEVTWDNNARAIDLVFGKSYTAVGGEMTPGSGKINDALRSRSPIYINGKRIELTAYNIGGNNYFKLRDLGQVFDFDVSWDNATRTITVDTSKSYTAD